MYSRSQMYPESVTDIHINKATTQTHSHASKHTTTTNSHHRITRKPQRRAQPVLRLQSLIVLLQRALDRWCRLLSPARVVFLCVLVAIIHSPVCENTSCQGADNNRPDYLLHTQIQRIAPSQRHSHQPGGAVFCWLISWSYPHICVRFKLIRASRIT